MNNPIKALEEEISEEVLPFTKYNQLIRFQINGKGIGNPFNRSFKDYDKKISLIEGDKYNLPNLTKFSTVNNRELEDAPRIFFDPQRNTAKWVFNYHADSDVDLSALEVSLHGSEDYARNENFDTSTKFKPYSIAMIRLDKSRLTDMVYFMDGGNLKEVDPATIILTEAFTLNEKSIAEKNKIGLMDFLKKQ